MITDRRTSNEAVPDPIAPSCVFCEKEYLRKDGTRQWLLFSGSSLGNNSCEEFCIDISARKRAEAALAESEQRFRGIVETAEEGIATHAPDGVITYVNQRMADILGYSRQELVGRSSLDFVDEQDRAAVIAMRQNVPESGSFSTEWKLRRRDGSNVWTLCNVSPQRDSDGRFFGYLAMHTDITERKRAEEDLKDAKVSAEEAKAAAEHASKAKDHFLAVLSHELRTPLAPVVATVAMLQSDPRFDADTRDYLEMIRRNVELEARLIDDLLDVTRIERGKIELDRQPVELCTVMRRAAEVCMPDIEARKLEFGIDTPDAPYLVEADVARLQQVFWNLLKNAIKFTPPGGCVDIRCRRIDGHVVAKVNDTGEGIDSELLPRLFNAFEQGGKHTTRQFGGLGLGLTISKAITEMHGGTLSAYSQGKGKGATFTLCLPLLTARDAVVSTARAPEVPSLARPIGPLRILLVEDHRDTARIMKRVLGAQGHEIQIATDVATALKLATEQPFDLLLSDLGLPDGSGMDVMRKLRERGGSTPGIALSGYGLEKDVRQSKEAGFAAHLVKPINAEVLTRTIGAVIDAARTKL